MQLFVKVVATPVVEVIASAVIGPSFGLPAGLGDPRHRLRLTVRNALFLSHDSAETEVIKNGRASDAEQPSNHWQLKPAACRNVEEGNTGYCPIPASTRDTLSLPRNLLL